MVAVSSMDPSPQGHPRWPGGRGWHTLSRLPSVLPPPLAAQSLVSQPPSTSADSWGQQGLVGPLTDLHGHAGVPLPNIRHPRQGLGSPVTPPLHCLAPALAAPSLRVLQRHPGDPYGVRGPTHQASSSSTSSSKLRISRRSTWESEELRVPEPAVAPRQIPHPRACGHPPVFPQPFRLYLGLLNSLVQQLHSLCIAPFLLLNNGHLMRAAGLGHGHPRPSPAPRPCPLGPPSPLYLLRLFSSRVSLQTCLLTLLLRERRA